MPPHVPTRRRIGALLAGSLAAPSLGALAGCATGSPPAPPPQPADFAFLTRLRLDVAEVLVDDRVPPPSAADRGARARVTPTEYLRAIARDRLLADGTSGRAVVTLQQAAIEEVRLPTRGTLFTNEVDTRYDGRMAMRVDLLAADGSPAGFAEAEVRRAREVLENVDAEGRRAAVEAVARDLADAMNVEIEFQIRRSLRTAMAEDRPATVQPVEQEQLAPPAR